MGSVFGRMFAIPSRETTYFTPNSKFYVVNYADSAVSISREVNIEQWKVHVKGVVNTPLALGWRDILNRDSYESSLHPHVYRHPPRRRQHGHRDLARHFVEETSCKRPEPTKRLPAM